MLSLLSWAHLAKPPLRETWETYKDGRIVVTQTTTQEFLITTARTGRDMGGALNANMDIGWTTTTGASGSINLIPKNLTLQLLIKTMLFVTQDKFSRMENVLMSMTFVPHGTTEVTAKPVMLDTPWSKIAAFFPQASKEKSTQNTHLNLVPTVFGEKLMSMEFVFKLMISAIPGMIETLNVPHVMVVIDLPTMVDALLIPNDYAISLFLNISCLKNE